MPYVNLETKAYQQRKKLEKQHNEQKLKLEKKQEKKKIRKINSVSPFIKLFVLPKIN